MDYTKLASPDSVQRASDALAARRFDPIFVESGVKALELIKTLIPKGASVMNGSSVTLEQIGFVEYLKAGEHGWNNLHAGILAENDANKRQYLRTQSSLSDYYLGSVHALSETGEMVIASNTGSQLPHLVYTSPNLILVVGTHKIVPTLEAAIERLHKHVVPLEDEHMKQLYGSGTTLNKTVILHGESAMMKRSAKVILVGEKLGF
ncbi:lactate utilization protein [Candidatus Kaiserbacteria bacterium]|nr:lactate utilization protein [Candidatus Kaiserbacteria bacterium]